MSLHAAPIALTEDTGGSTRCPAASNGNFGYEPYQNKVTYPSEGNLGKIHASDMFALYLQSSRLLPLTLGRKLVSRSLTGLAL